MANIILEDTVEGCRVGIQGEDLATVTKLYNRLLETSTEAAPEPPKKKRGGRKNKAEAAPEPTPDVTVDLNVKEDAKPTQTIKGDNNVQAGGDVVEAKSTETVVEPEPEPAPAAETPALDGVLGITAEDFEGVKKRRDIVRTIMGKGVTDLDDVIAVCEGLKGEVRLLQMLGNIPPAIKAAYDAVQAENQAS